VSRAGEVSPSRSETVEEWDRWAATYEETGGLFTRINDDWIVRQLRPRGRRVLDVGCGTGRLARRLAPEAREVVGIDTSPRMIERAREDASPNTRFQRLSVLELSSEESFDIIVVCYLFHHMDPANVLPILNDVLRPGGTLLILEPIRGHVMQRVAYLFRATRAFGWASTVRLMKGRFTSAAWKGHSLRDRLSDYSTFRTQYARLLPGADIRRVHSLFGAVLWRKNP